jgi:hypothetical protein
VKRVTRNTGLLRDSVLAHLKPAQAEAYAAQTGFLRNFATGKLGENAKT